MTFLNYTYFVITMTYLDKFMKFMKLLSFKFLELREKNQKEKVKIKLFMP